MVGFERRRDPNDFFGTGLLGLKGKIDEKDAARLQKMRQAWNFYEGYHWEGFDDVDSPEITVNYCRAFVDKFVAFELGKAFTFSVSKNMVDPVVTSDGRTLFEFLEDVWEDNNQYAMCTEIGQTKSITGEAWVQVRYTPPEEMRDPYNEYENGRISLQVLPTTSVFPEFDPHNRGVLTKLVVMYAYKRHTTSYFGKDKEEVVVYKQTWTPQECIVEDGNDKKTYPNKYKVIPFIQIKNIIVAGKNEGRGDLEDVIPLNTEFNMKESNVSEILDYHAAPITVVYGAKLGNLEKGANKLWGGLAKDAKVENLELKGDLGASTTHINDVKRAMCEIGGIPEAVLGATQSISNTSGVALQYMNMPIIERTRLKKISTEDGLERLNKLIILVALLEGFITRPEGVSNRDFYKTEVSLPDTLPKDTLLELQQINLEMKSGLESRKGAMKRLNKEDIDSKIAEIDEDRENHPDVYGIKQEKETPDFNSGMTNGETAIETVRKEVTGQNGGATL